MNSLIISVSDNISNSSMALSSGIRMSVCSFCHRFSVPFASFRLPKHCDSSSGIYFFTITRPISFLPNANPRRGDNARCSRKSSNLDAIVVDREVNDGRILSTELHKEATDAYMAYAMSVMLGRALPDARDGLKPVHRRILYAMHELGLSSRKAYKKCARVVGEVLGKFHPHGDTAVYDSLVRMAQDFCLRCPLIQGHGNFGSIDADPPAAMRYTECKLDGLAEAMLLADLEQDTVDFVPNFDNSYKEPSVLPTRIPALLLNGSSGIAVGMATNIPPHNLGELVDALSLLIKNPEATLQELLECIPGPDFPTGGVIMGNTGVLEAYKTGRGHITVRGRASVETIDPQSKRMSIIISEIPYQTNKASLVEKIAEHVESKNLEGIADIRDESDRNGMRIVIELKRGSDSCVVLNNLYRLTALQSTFGCNMVSIIDGQPKQTGLKELLQAFLDFRCSVVERRAKFQLSQAQSRRLIVEGIIVGLENVDRVIHLIRNSSSNEMALSGLIREFDLSEKQAEAIMDINLRRLTSHERKKFIDENKSLMEEIARLRDLLSNKQEILRLIEQEAIEIKSKFATPRRSHVDDTSSGEVDEIDVIQNEEILLSLSEKGYIKRLKFNMFTLQNRGTIGKSVGKLRVNDTMLDIIACHARDHILFFSDKGTVYSTRAYKIPESSRAAAGTPLAQIFSLTDERITSIIPVSEFHRDLYLVMVTVHGYIKKVPLSFFSAIRSTGIIAIQLVPGDQLCWVQLCSDDDVAAMASQNGRVILCSCNSIRSSGRQSRGSTAMKLKDGDRMASIDIIPTALSKNLKSLSNEQRERSISGPWLLFVSENGFGKRVPLNSFGLSHLNRTGVIGYKFAVEDRLAAVFVVEFSSLNEDGESDEQVLLVSQSGTVNRIKVRDVSIQSRHARGVILMRLDHGVKIQSASLVSAAESQTSGGMSSQ